MAQTRDTKPTLGQTTEEMLEPIRAWLQVGTSLQSELLTLWNHRAAAYLELPRQLSACRSPSDLVEEQINFLSTMQRDYSDCATALLRNAKPALEQVEQSAPRDARQRAA